MTQDTTTAQPRTRQQHAIDRAIAKAHEQARAGNLPILLSHQAADGQPTHQVWSVGSRTTAGSVYTIDLVADADGIVTLCDCAAADAQRVCWHRASARLATLGCIDHWAADTGALVEAQPARCDEARRPEIDDVTAYAATA